MPLTLHDRPGRARGRPTAGRHEYPLEDCVAARPEHLRKTAGGGGGADTKSALLDALQESMEDAKDRDVRRATEEVSRTARRRTSPVILACSLILVATAAWLGLARPEWVFPTTAPVRSTAQVESGLRIGLYLEARQVSEYSARLGRPPRTLEEAGIRGSSSRYELLPDGRWRLGATEAGQALRITSEDDLAGFLGSSFSHLRGGRR